MNAMIAAIKKRKAGGQAVEGDHQDATHPSQHTDDADHEAKMQDMVSSMSESQKHSLRAALEKDKSGSNHAEQIGKGGPSQEEQGKIQEQAQTENAKSKMAMQEDDEQDLGPQGLNPDDHDKLAMSMLDSRDKSGMAPSKPRNLGERVRAGIASKLKAKGKL